MEPDGSDDRPGDPPWAEQAWELLGRLVSEVLRRLPVSAVPSISLAFLGHDRAPGDQLYGFFGSPRWSPDPREWPKLVAARVATPSDEVISWWGEPLDCVAFGRLVQEGLITQDSHLRTRSFSGSPIRVDAYDFVPIVEFLSSDVTMVPAASQSPPDGLLVAVNLLEAAMFATFYWFASTVRQRDRGATPFRTDIDGILRHAGRVLMHSVQRSVSKNAGVMGDLFTQLDGLSALRHEHAESAGQIAFVPSSLLEDLDHVRLEAPVPLEQISWARKLLELAPAPFGLFSDGESIVGFGDLRPMAEASAREGVRTFVARFEAQHRWVLQTGSDILIHTASGIPRLPIKPLDKERFSQLYRRVLPSGTAADVRRTWRTVDAILEQDHGAVVVVAADAESEATRLSNQATRVAPKVLSTAEAKQAARIDGALLLDASGRCHAIGVILDGAAVPTSDASRGARFNSALRYVNGTQQRLAIVRSEDGWVDVFPRLREQMRRSELAGKLEMLRAAGKGRTTTEMRRAAVLVSSYSEELDLSKDDWATVNHHKFDYFRFVMGEPRQIELYDPHPTDLLPESAPKPQT